MPSSLIELLESNQNQVLEHLTLFCLFCLLVAEGTHFLIPWLQKAIIFDVRTKVISGLIECIRISLETLAQL